MSRDIKTAKEPDNEVLKAIKNKETGKLIFTCYNKRPVMLFIAGNRLQNMHFGSQGASYQGGIYVGRIQKLNPQKTGAFVEFQKKTVGFLPLKQGMKAKLVNREYDGTVKEGDLILCQVAQNPFKTKLASMLALTDEKPEFEPYIASGAHKIAFTVLKEPKNPFIGLYERNLSDEEVEEVIFDQSFLNEELWQYFESKGFSMRKYEDATFPLSSLYSIPSKCEEALAKHVWLKSGAYLVIEQTEAFVVIDVNSGKNIKSGKESEDKNLEINLEAAKEAALQIRLRNLSGSILIDFINQKNPENRLKLIEAMTDAMQFDPVEHRVFDITRLGIMELTRKKNGKTLMEEAKEEVCNEA